MQTFTIGSLPAGDFIALDQATYEKFKDMLRGGNDASGKHARKDTKWEDEHCEAFRAQGMMWSAPQHVLIERDTVSQQSAIKLTISLTIGLTIRFAIILSIRFTIRCE